LEFPNGSVELLFLHEVWVLGSSPRMTEREEDDGEGGVRERNLPIVKAAERYS
jgi:hypothetical protein